MVKDKRQKTGRQSYYRGVWAELLCMGVLAVKGYRVVARRYKTRLGEIDLIARKGNVMIFVEVKARPSQAAANEALSSGQQQRLKQAAALYLSGRPSLSRLEARFDVMLVVPWRLPVHYVNAF